MKKIIKTFYILVVSYLIIGLPVFLNSHEDDGYSSDIGEDVGSHGRDLGTKVTDADIDSALYQIDVGLTTPLLFEKDDIVIATVTVEDSSFGHDIKVYGKIAKLGPIVGLGPSYYYVDVGDFYEDVDLADFTEEVELQKDGTVKIQVDSIGKIKQ